MDSTYWSGVISRVPAVPNEGVEKASGDLAPVMWVLQDRPIDTAWLRLDGPLQANRYSPRFLPVDLSQQLLPGTFEHALNHLLDHELDLSELDQRFCNDLTGAPAYLPARHPAQADPVRLLPGIVSSRQIERACRENVVFIALSGDSAPHFTTVAAFIRELSNEVADVFTQVLFICDAQGLIGREMFAIDGVKLPGNAAKAKSGSRAEFEHQTGKIEIEVKKMLARHCDDDHKAIEPDLEQREATRIERLKRDAAQIRQWLQVNPEERRGAKGAVRKSNHTHNESAKMATGKGVIQGYTGVAAVDAKCQVIVEAQAHGSGSDQELLLPVVEAIGDLIQEGSIVTADAVALVDIHVDIHELYDPFTFGPDVLELRPRRK